MKKITLLCLFTIGIILAGCELHQHEKKQSINPVLNDISFIARFGHTPDATTDEDLRIQTHLQYVETLLRDKNTTNLTPDLQQKRSRLLDLLHQYRVNGIFPRNYDYKNKRVPCFIDKNNRICAVGYLVEKTAGLTIAREINTRHQYDEILAMNDKTVDSWIATSGLTKEECAMIQPTYGPPPTYTANFITPAYGISSAVLGGVNLSINTLNGVQLARGTNHKTVAIAGLVSGAGQTILGAAMFPKTTTGFNGNTTNESRKILSMVNIGLGTSTMILSAWNLITNRKPSFHKTTWNINSFETPNNQPGVALNIFRRL